MNKISRYFLMVNVAISIATFIHSSYGFGTISGNPDYLEGFDLIWWWFIGGLSSASIDIGMGAIVYALLNGWKNKWMTRSLLVLALFSAYSQLIYAGRFAQDITVQTKVVWINDILQPLVDLRILLLPIALPMFALIYAFASKSKQDEDRDNSDSEIILIREPKTVSFYNEVTSKLSVIHSCNFMGETTCGYKGNDSQRPIFHYNSEQFPEITCKNCLRKLSNA